MVAITVLQAAPAVGQPIVQAPTIRSGDQWTYVRIGPGPTRLPDEVVRIITTNTAQQTLVESVRTLDLRSTTPMSSGTRAGREQRHLVSLEPLPPRVLSGGMPWITFPIEVGKTWRYSRRYADAQGIEWTETGDAEVQAVERIDVPAGRFDAFRVHHRWRLLAPGPLDWPHEMTLWYAPTVKRWVRLDYAGERRGGSANITERYRLDLTSHDLQPD